MSREHPASSLQCGQQKQQYCEAGPLLTGMALQDPKIHQLGETFIWQALMKVTSAAIRSFPRHWAFMDSLFAPGNTGRKTSSHFKNETQFREEELVQGHKKKMAELMFNPFEFFVIILSFLSYFIKTKASNFCLKVSKAGSKGVPFLLITGRNLPKGNMWALKAKKSVIQEPTQGTVQSICRSQACCGKSLNEASPSTSVEMIRQSHDHLERTASQCKHPSNNRTCPQPPLR